MRIVGSDDLGVVSELALTSAVQRLRKVAGDWQRNERNDVVEPEKATSAQRELDQLFSLGERGSRSSWEHRRQISER